MFTIFSQPLKADSQIVNTLFGKVISVKALQSRNAAYPMFVTPFGITTRLSLQQFSKRPVLISLISFVKVIFSSS